MNYSTLGPILSDEMNFVSVRFSSKSEAPSYTYKNFIQNLKEGDVVIIPGSSEGSYKCGYVTEVDVSIDVDRDDINYKWIVAGPVDTTTHDQLVKQEENLIKQLKKREKSDELLGQTDPGELPKLTING